MRFRDATESDIPGIVPLFDGRNAAALEPRVRRALPQLLVELLSSPACTLAVFEEEGRSGLRLFSLAGGLFVRDDVIDAYLAHPFPGLVSGILAAMLDRRTPLLTQDEIRHANSGAGLNLVVFSMPLGRLDWDDPSVHELRKLAPQAFIRHIGGYRLRAIYYEVFLDEVAAYLQGGGYRLLHDFSAQAGTGILGPDSRARMMCLTRADLPPGAMSMATQMFDPPPARLGLTQAEQRIALRALQGASDRAIADALALSVETVRSGWRSIYRRLAHVLVDADSAVNPPDEATRGLEKRRLAIEYLRQNMHELRPVLPPRRRGHSAGG